ncbi:hypothetical protein [Nocardioides sp.]|uniref:hypothetical protein n=1 Tax=Nocardioides sp. TaxID=35761 RepID=UPI003518FC18
MPQVIRVTDETTPEQLLAFIAQVNAWVKRLPKTTGLPHFLTPCDSGHEQINMLIDEWRARR